MVDTQEREELARRVGQVLDVVEEEVQRGSQSREVLAMAALPILQVILKNTTRRGVEGVLDQVVADPAPAHRQKTLRCLALRCLEVLG